MLCVPTLKVPSHVAVSVDIRAMVKTAQVHICPTRFIKVMELSKLFAYCFQNVA